MLLWPFNKYPGTDYETFNWEWLIGLGKKMEQALYDLFSDTGALHQMVDKVLKEHPEWVTTVMDGAITAAKIQPDFLKQILNVWATPDEFGAAGDGATDDSAAIQAAIDSGRPVAFKPGTTYKSSTALTIPSNTTIHGMYATIDSDENVFEFPLNTANVYIKALNTIAHYTPGSNLPTIVHYLISGTGNNEYYSHDIVLEDIDMTGGVMGVAATSVKNLVIKNPKAAGMVYKPETYAGGYGILLQSCVDVDIENYIGKIGTYGRHDIYVSVDQTKTDNIKSKNIKIDGISSNRSDMTLNGTNFYSSNTSIIVVRAASNVDIDNVFVNRGAGFISVTPEDGDIDGLNISNVTIKNPIPVSGVGETKSFFNMLGGYEYHTHANISNVSIEDVNDNYTQFAQLANCDVSFNNIDMGPTAFILTNGVTVFVDNARTDTTSYVFRFNGTDTVNGRVRNVYNRYRSSWTVLYNIGNAALVDEFFSDNLPYGRPTLTATTATSYNIQYPEAESYGDMVCMHFRLNCTAYTSTAEQIATISKPPKRVQQTSLAIIGNTGNDSDGNLEIRTDGTIWANRMPASTHQFVNITYIGQ